MLTTKKNLLNSQEHPYIYFKKIKYLLEKKGIKFINVIISTVLNV